MSYSAYVPQTRLFARTAILMSLTIGGLLVAVSAQARDGNLSPALQVSVDACARRQGTTPEARILSCTEATNSINLVGLGRADAYLSRAEAYMTSGNHERALADYEESVRLRALQETGV